MHSRASRATDENFDSTQLPHYSLRTRDYSLLKNKGDKQLKESNAIGEGTVRTRTSISLALLLVGPLQWLILSLLEQRLGAGVISGVVPTSALGAGVFFVLYTLFWFRQLGWEGAQRVLLGGLFFVFLGDLYLCLLNPLWGGFALVSVLFALRAELPESGVRIARATRTERIQGHKYAFLIVGLVGVFARDGYHVELGLWGDWILAGSVFGSYLLGGWLDWRRPVLDRAQPFIWLLRVIAVWPLVQSSDSAWTGLLLVPDFMVTAVVLWRGRLGEIIRKDSFENPPMVILGGFGVMVAIGTLLLSLPLSSSTGSSVGFIPALFTSTSAVCVTGLSVLDVGNDFSFFGQVVLLVLIQLGGLGIITLSVFVAVLLGTRMGLQQTWAFAELSEQFSPSSMRRLVKEIISFTLAAEVFGAVLLIFAVLEPGGGYLKAIWFGIFHSVSAFCNAGFALQSDSLLSFRHNISVLGPIAVLVVLGGLGFVPLSVLASRFFGHRHRLNLHTKVALAGTAAFLLLGAFGTWLLQYAQPEKGMSLGDAMFWSVTLRTAGFNHIPMESLSPASALWSMALMMVGGCPGGTAGGVKVTTVLLLFLAVRGLLREEYELQLLHRTVPRRTVIRALVVVVLSVGFVFVGFLALLATQSRLSFMELGFEAVSAFGTVGLSLGVTPRLDASGITIIALLMFVGRVGPLALAYGLGRSKKLPWRGAKDDIHVG